MSSLEISCLFLKAIVIRDGWGRTVVAIRKIYDRSLGIQRSPFPPKDRRFEQNFQTLASVLWGGSLKNFPPVPGKFFPLENFFHTSCCLCAYFFIGYALWWCFSPSQRLFLGLGYIRLGALRAPHQTHTSVPKREVTKKIPLRGFLVVRPSGASPDPRVGPLGGVNASPWGWRTLYSIPRTAAAAAVYYLTAATLLNCFGRNKNSRTKLFKFNIKK